VNLFVVVVSVDYDKGVACICFCYHELVSVYFVLYFLGCYICDVLVWSKLRYIGLSVFFCLFTSFCILLATSWPHIVLAFGC
jgi:hypothetical protein